MAVSLRPLGKTQKQDMYMKNKKEAKLLKMLSDSKRKLLDKAVKENINKDAYVLEYDEEEGILYIEIWDGCYHNSYEVSYLANEDYSEIEVDSTLVAVEVEYSKTYTEKSSDSIADKVLGKLLKHFGRTKKETPLSVITKFDNDEMIEVSQLYCAPNVTDTDNDFMDLEQITKMVSSLNEAIQTNIIKANYDHEKDEDGVFTSTEDFTFIKAWVAECDCTIGDDFVAEGTPLLKTQYNNPDVWNERKSGEYTGWSIGACYASTEEVELVEKSAKDTKNKKARLLKDVTFPEGIGHVALTSGGAASRVNKPFLLKSEQKDTGNVVTPDIKIEDDDKSLTKDSENKMDEEVQAKLEALEAENAALLKQVALKALAAYKLEEELASELADTIKSENLDLVIKALDSVASAEDKEDAITDIAKQLEKAKGHEGGELEDEDISLLARLNKADKANKED